MEEFIEGLIMLIVPLSIIGFFLIKWRKDYKQTGKLLVLYDKKTKWRQLLISILFLVFSVFVILSAISVIEEDDNTPIQITPEQYNPWGWYI
ncbi:MAG: hypothetical protein ABH919_02065 [bacterium]